MKRKFMMTACILVAVFIFVAAIIAVLEKAGITNFIDNQNKSVTSGIESTSQVDAQPVSVQTSDSQTAKPDQDESINLRSRGE
jgi:hypothetical protein